MFFSLNFTLPHGDDVVVCWLLCFFLSPSHASTETKVSIIQFAFDGPSEWIGIKLFVAPQKKNTLFLY